MRVIITGDPEDLKSRLPLRTEAGKALEWQILPVLAFEPVEMSPEIVTRLKDFRPHWLIFLSPRGVTFGNRWMLANDYQLSVTTRIACMGERTRAKAEQEGWEVDFVPERMGSEGFVEEFLPLLSEKSSILILCALQSREYLCTTLGGAGHSLLVVPVYRTVPSDRVEDPETAQGVVFTSPSSYEAYKKRWPGLLKSLRLFAIGEYTATRMREDGVAVNLVPDGNVERLGEIL
ncbi:MAG: uroporphyrinogen-III synthase [Deltaproteobacteria bacterium]|nr:uroporphyrinogen-III synthase [Deltaproteobacteria bacterium]